MLNLKRQIMFSGILLCASIGSALAFFDSNRTVIEYIQKKHYEGKEIPLLANEERAMPFKGALVFRVVNPGSSNQGWRVWLNLADRSVHPIETGKTLVDYLKSLETPLSQANVRKTDLAQAKRITNRLLMLYPARGAKVGCKKATSEITCSIRAETNETATLVFSPKDEKITLRP